MQHLQKTGGWGDLPSLLERASRRSLADSSPFLSHSCALFCTHQESNSFLFKRFRTLCEKTPRGGGRGWRGELAATWANSKCGQGKPRPYRCALTKRGS